MPPARHRHRRLPVIWIFAVFFLMAILVGGAVIRIRATSASPQPLGSGFWHTSGTQVLDSENRPIRIASLTWYGMETSYWVPAGLDHQPYTRIMDLVKLLGYNAIRLPYSNELVEKNPIVTRRVSANPQLRGMHAMSVLDLIAGYAQRIGVKIILDDHVSFAERPSAVNTLVEATWYAPGYPETSWIRDWQTLAERYKSNDAIIGFDLRNEPHTAGPGPWTVRAYETQGATWGPSGSADPTSDWRAAAEAAGNAALAINPHLLMFVEGVQLYPDPSQPGGVAWYWWGSILSPVKQYPIQFAVSHQLVYSPHDWGPRKYPLSWFQNMTYTSMLTIWHRYWSFILDNPHAPYAAPVWIGEFGTCTELPTCVDQQLPGNQATWFHLLLRFLKEHPSVGWDFFALNGTNANNGPTDNGLLNPHWDGVANVRLQRDLLAVSR
jgi:endoglucanase